jgi:hypothetical protein
VHLHTVHPVAEFVLLAHGSYWVRPTYRFTLQFSSSSVECDYSPSRTPALFVSVNREKGTAPLYCCHWSAPLSKEKGTPASFASCHRSGVNERCKQFDFSCLGLFERHLYGNDSLVLQCNVWDCLAQQKKQGPASRIRSHGCTVLPFHACQRRVRIPFHVRSDLRLHKQKAWQS